jgi:hypothetical protein
MGLASPWPRFALVLGGGSAALALAALALTALVDPYDSGRSPLAGAPVQRSLSPRTAAAGLGRDPRFDAAVVGNSHAQLLAPARLDALTGRAFVQLTIPGSGPGEQLAVAGWFLRHHPGARALVVAADPTWCTDDPALTPGHPFPDWLYADDPRRYLAGLFRLSAAGEAAGRLVESVSRPPRARPDGYRDYEPEFARQSPAERAAALAVRPPDGPDRGRAGPFPAAGRLAELLARAPAALRVVLVLPPVHPDALPRPGTPRAAAEAACKAALAGALSAAIGARGAVVDRRRPGADPDGFFDPGHYRMPLARELERAIAEALAPAPRAP